MPSHIKATTQEHLNIEDITHNIIILKDGSAAMVLKVRAVNFNLLSDREQESIIYSYAGLLNSLSFPIQILIRSQRKDITNYINLLKNQELKQFSQVYKDRLARYREFIEKIVKERNVLDKKFYVIIPFSRLELGLAANSNPLSKAPQKLTLDKNYVIQKALNALEPKRDHLMRQFAHLNLSPKQLTTQDLIQLFYTIYNPDASEGIVLATPSQYQQSLVQSSTQLNPQPVHDNPSSPNASAINPNQDLDASPAPANVPSEPLEPATSNQLTPPNSPTSTPDTQLNQSPAPSRLPQAPTPPQKVNPANPVPAPA
jgi:hypothetical protein